VFAFLKKGLLPGIIIIILITVRYSFFTTAEVKSFSMSPLLKRGDHIIAFNFFQRRNIPRQSIVLLRCRQQTSKKYDYLVKQIIGRAGDTVQICNGNVKINNKKLKETGILKDCTDWGPLKLSRDEYFVLGNFRTMSIDSRQFGPVKKNEIEGLIFAVYYPFPRIKFF